MFSILLHCFSISLICFATLSRCISIFPICFVIIPYCFSFLFICFYVLSICFPFYCIVFHFSYMFVHFPYCFPFLLYVLCFPLLYKGLSFLFFHFLIGSRFPLFHQASSPYSQPTLFLHLISQLKPSAAPCLPNTSPLFVTFVKYFALRIPVLCRINQIIATLCSLKNCCLPP